MSSQGYSGSPTLKSQPRNFFKTSYFPGNSNSPHRDTEAGCLKASLICTFLSWLLDSFDLLNYVSESMKT